MGAVGTMLSNARTSLSWSATSLAIQTVFGVLSFVLIARIFGAETFGIYAGTIGFVGIATGFAALGSAELAARRLIRARESSEFPADEALGRLFSVLLTIAPFVLVGAALAGAAIFDSIADTFAERALIVLLLAFGEICATGFGSAANGSLLALDEDRKAAMVSSSRAVMRVIAIFIFGTASSSILFLGFAVASAGLGTLIIGGTIFRGLGVRPALSQRWREDWREGFDIALGSTARSTTQDVDQTILLRNDMVLDTGLYGAGARISHYAFLPVMAVLQVTYPKYFEHGKNGIAASWKFCKKVGVPLVGYGLFAGVALLIGQLFVPSVLGEDFEGAQPMIIALSAVPLVRVLNSILGDVLISSGYVAARTRPVVIGAVANLVANIIVIPRYGWEGAAVTTYATELGVVAVYVVLIRRHIATEARKPIDTTAGNSHARQS